MGNLRSTNKSKPMSSDRYFGDTINSPWYRSVEFAGNEIPELDKMEPGKEYRLVILTKLKEKSEVDSDEGCRGRFEIVAVKAEDEVKELDDNQKKYVKLLG